MIRYPSQPLRLVRIITAANGSGITAEVFCLDKIGGVILADSMIANDCGGVKTAVVLTDNDCLPNFP